MREDWIEIELGNVLHTTSGGTPSRRNPDYYSGSIPWVKSGELNQNTILETEEYISEEAVKNSSAKIFPKGTLLIALYGATIGKLAFLGIEAATNQAVCGIFKNDAIESKFLYYFLFHNRRKLVEKGAGGAQPNISQTILKNLPIVIASLPEQRAIVARIEELFSELDHVISNLKSAQAKLEIYRQAVLKKAFEGNYSMIQVGELFDFLGGGTPSKNQSEFWNGEIPWASVKDIKGECLKDTKDHISEMGLKKSSSTIASKGEVILITRISPGKAILTNIDVAINQDLKVVKPKNQVNNKYTFYLFKSIENTCLKLSSGTTVKGINLQNLKSIKIPKIEFELQTQIVQEIESRLSVADKLAETIQTNLLKSESLRQSILKKAFEGKLLSEAELAVCRKEADWEPADRLLERIKNEKTKK
jgi:type I restriction enzyme S subunit